MNAQTQSPVSKSIFTSVSAKETDNESELLDVVTKEEQTARDTIATAQIRLQQAAEMKAKIEESRQQKTQEQHADLLEKARLYREAASNRHNPDETIEYIKLAEAYEKEANTLIPKELTPEPEPMRFLGISTTKGLLSLGVLGALATILFWVMGTVLVTNAENDSAMRMMNSVGLRILTNFLPFILAFLVSVGTIWLLFPSVYHYWHNRIKTEASIIDDLNKATPWQRLAFFSFCFALPVWAYVMLMQVIFG